MGEIYAYIGTWEYEKSVPSSQFFCEPRTALKTKVWKEKKKKPQCLNTRLENSNC